MSSGDLIENMQIFAKFQICYGHLRFFKDSYSPIRWSKTQVFKTSKKLIETAKIAQINTIPYQKQEQDFI